MALWALKSGSKKDAAISTAANKAANVGFDVPVNPLIRNDALTLGTANYGIACYEIRINNDLGDESATNGVSNTNSSFALWDLLNRYYPDNLHVGFDATQHSNNYGTNLENTPGHRIVCAHLDGEGVVTSLSSSSLTTNDYFVVIYADDYTKHHIAKITESLTFDLTGDAFEFSPAYPSTISKGTKFSIYKGPLVTNTDVVAVAYGLKGSGSTPDDRHLNYARLYKPTTYFYNDRLEKDNRLNHNTKYKICCSYLSTTSDVTVTGSGTHVQTHFITEPNYGNRIIDYGPYATPAKLIDNRRESTTFGDVLTSSGSNLQALDPEKQTAFTITDLSNWDTCFLNIYRSSDNKNKHNSPSGWTGPTRYLHYASSPDKNNTVTSVFDLEINNSITKAGSYASASLVDTNKIWGKKIKRFDRLKFKQVIATGRIDHNKDFALEGRVWSADNFETEHNITSSTFSNNVLIVQNTPEGYNLKVLLQDKATGEFESIKVGDYNYTISAIGNPLFTNPINPDHSIKYQTITVDKERIITSSSYGTADTNAKNFEGELLYRKVWSSITNTLLVDFNIDTNVDYDGDVDGSVYNTKLDVACGFTASGNTVDVTAHGLIAGQSVWFNTINTTTGISINTTYYVKSSPNANDFQLVTNSDGSGSAIALTNDGTGIISGDYPALDANVRLDYYGNKSDDGVFTNSRIYGLEIELKNNEYFNKSLSVKFGDKLHKYIKLQTPRHLMYQDYTQSSSKYPNYLDYYEGPYVANRLIFKGKVESLEEYIEFGIMKYRLSGRDDISTLLGPILNKDYKYSEDMIYSTVGPLILTEDSTGNVNGVGGYAAGQRVITVDNSGSFEAGDLVFLSRSSNLDRNGHFIGRIASTSGSPVTQLTFEEGILINLEHNDSLYVNTSHNLVAFSKSISSNPSIATTSNLNSASGKGLIFTGGNLISKSSGIPQIESTALIGTSANSSSNALGYYLHGAYEIGKDNSFASILADETNVLSISKKEIHTPSSITPFDIISISSGEGNTTIELAPICPTILARIDNNYKDNRFTELVKDVSNIQDEELIDTNLNVYQYTIGNSHYIKTQQNIYTVEGEDSQISNIGDYLYRSDKTYIGKIIAKYRDDATTWVLQLDYINGTLAAPDNLYRLKKDTHTGSHSGSNNAATLTMASGKWFTNQLVGMTIHNTTDSSQGIITANTPTTITASLSGGTDNDWDTDDDFKIYDTKYKSSLNHIYFLNTQGLDSGGVIQLMNSQFSYAGKPIQFSGIFSDDSSGTDGDFVSRYGGFTWKYTDLQIGNPGSISYVDKRIGDNTEKLYYSENKGNACGYSIAYKFKPGAATSSNQSISPYKDFYPDTKGKLEKRDIPNRGIYPATGSNFNDSSHHSTSNTGEWDLLPKYSGDSKWAYDWIDTAQSSAIWVGERLNIINEIKDNWELVDPKTIRWFIFGKSDLYPDSKTRQHNLFNQTRKLTDYNLLIKNKPNLEQSDNTHSNYIGSLSRQQENDSSYETLDILDSTVTSDQIKRFGIMRLIEMTFDWHFNSFDPELPPSINSLLPERKTNATSAYYKYTEIVTSGETVANPAQYTSGATVINCGTTVTGVAANDRIYTNKGYFIGKVASVGGSSINLNSAADYDPITGDYYFGTLYKCTRNDPASATIEANMINYSIQGKESDATFIKSNSTKGMNMLQGAIFGDNYYIHNTGIELNFSAGFSPKTANTGTAQAGAAQIVGVSPATITLAAAANADNNYYNDMVIKITGGRGSGQSKVITDYVGSTKIADVGGTSGVDNWIVVPDNTSTYEIKAHALKVDGGNPRTYFTDGDSAFWYDDTKFCVVKYAGSSVYDTTPTPSSSWVINQTYAGVAQTSTTGSGSGMEFTITTDGSGNPTITDITTDGVNHKIGDDIVLTEPGSARTCTVKLSCIATRIVTNDDGLINSIADNNNFWSHSGKHGIDIGNHFDGAYGHTDYGGAYSGALQANKDDVCLPIIGTPINPGTSIMHTIFDKFYTPAGGSTYTDMQHPSKILELIAGGTATDSTRATWRGTRAIFLDRYSIENQDVYYTVAGMSTTSIAYSYRKVDSKPSGLTQLDGATSSPRSYIFLGTYNISFAEKTKRDVNTTNPSSTGELTGDGAYLGFKPILDASVASVSTITSINSNLTCKILKFTITRTTQNNQWLNFCSDLTGCYLVSSAGEIYNTTTASGDYTHNTAYNVKPSVIHYVISHKVEYSGSTKIHHLMIDNAATIKDVYRIMRPAETCFWSGLLGNDEIKLYTLDSAYTKKPNSNKGYNLIPLFGYQDSNGKHTLGEREEGTNSTTSDYNEGVLSMYVVVDPDALSYNASDIPNTSYLVNRKAGYLFDVDKPLNDISGGYSIYLNDGNNTFKSAISIKHENTSNSHSLKFSNSSKMPKLNGIVSVGKIFNIKTIKPVNINNPITAYIGSSVTIGQEAETLINDIFENNNIVFTSSAIEYPYIIAPIFKGVDLYTATDYLANIKKKRVISTTNNIKVTKEKDPYDYTNIEISHENANINIIEVSKADNTFDFYNEITVYGKNVKATKSRRDSIQEIGKKTLEEFDNRITTKEEAIKRARDLLRIHTKDNERFKIKLIASNISLLNPGDIITINLPEENMPRRNYIVLESRKSIEGTTELEVGTYDKNMADRLAELFAITKKIDSELRDKQNISTGEMVDMDTKMTPKILKIKITRIGTQAGLTSIAGITPIGSVSDEIIYEEVFV